MTPDRRSMARWFQLIGSEYRDMPGLSLTKPQMQRLWSLEPVVCDVLVEALVAARVLRRTAHATYVSTAQMAVRSRQLGHAWPPAAVVDRRDVRRENLP